jgi:hypothetical protein
MLDVFIANAHVTVYTRNIQHGEDHQVNLVGNVIVRFVNTQEKNR